MATLDLFNVLDCCGSYEPTAAEHMMDMAYFRFGDTIATLHKRAVADNIFGKTSGKGMRSIQNLNYLLLYLYFIQELRTQKVEKDGSDYALSYYVSTYSLECIAKRFYCQGIRAQDVMSIFNLYPFHGLLDDGINFMSIEASTSPINRVSDEI